MFDRRTLPLSALRAFESAGHRLHMGKAGEDLGVTYGAISHQIRSLEKELDTKLFTRENNSLQLTSAGAQLLEAVSEGFDRIIEGTRNLKPYSLSGDLVVGCTQTAGANWAAKIISEFHQRYPLINIRTVEIKPQQREVPKDIDVAICYGKPTDSGRNIQELASLEVFPVCSPRLIHAQDIITEPQDLTNYPLLHEGLNNWSRWFSTMNKKIPESTTSLNFFNTNLTLSAARDGYGIALCNRMEAQKDLLEGHLVRLLERSIPEIDSYYLLTHHSEKQSLRAKLFEDWIKEVFEDK